MQLKYLQGGSRRWRQRGKYDTALILLRLVTSFLAFTHVVHEILRDLSQSSTFLAEVDDDAGPAPLGRLDALLDGVREIRAARADVGPEDIGTITLVVDAHRELHIFVLDLRRVAPDVGRHAADGRQEDLEVVPACVEINQCLAARNRHRHAIEQ